AILASAQKKREKYPAWLVEEADQGLNVYWRAVKARIPAWRAPAETRQAWQSALKARSQPPLIDPHVIDPMDFRDAVSTDPAYNLWSARDQWADDTRTGLANARAAENTDLASFDAVLVQALFGQGPLDALTTEEGDANRARSALVKSVTGLEMEN